jgi:hypothetical protein
MKNSRSSKTLSVILLASVSLWIAVTISPRSEASAATNSAAYAFTFQVNTPTTVPDGATVTCKAKLAPRLSGIEQVVAAPVPIESIEGVARVSGSSATCSVRMPFAFAADETRNGAALSYEIDGSTASGPVFVRTQKNISIPLPQVGSTQNLLLNINL